MTLLGIRIRIRVLSPIIFLLMIAFSGPQTVLPPLAALAVHEFAHLACAVALKAQIDEIELMPFGAAMRLYALWELSPIKLMSIALAGPLANLVFCAFLSLLLFFFPSLAPAFSSYLYSGLLIAFVNLLPALPLDGGRFLCALLALKMRRSRAVGIGILLGRILGVVLILLSVCAFFKTHVIPLPPLLASVYLFYSGEQERRHSEDAAMRMLLIKREPDAPVRRASLLMVKKNAPILDALHAVRPGEDCLFAVTDDEGEILTLLPLKKVMYALHENISGSAENHAYTAGHKIFESFK